MTTDDTTTDAPRTRQRHACPRCGATPLTPIAYGYPGPGMMEQVERGEISLGGCCISDSQPTHRCPSCGRSFELQRSGGWHEHATPEDDER